MTTTTIEYPTELTTALGKRPQEVVGEIRMMAALKLFESGRVSSGLAAQLAGISRVEFLVQCGLYGVSVFQQNVQELEADQESALHGRG